MSEAPNALAVNAPEQRRARDEKRRAVSQRRFLACLGASCSVLKAARAAKVGRVTHYLWMKEDPTYPARFREAMQVAVRTLEDHCVKLAFEGVKRLVTYKGRPVKDPETGGWLYEAEYDSNVAMFLLKAYDRKRFGDKIENTFREWTGDLEDLPDEVIKRIEELLLAKIAARKAKAVDSSQVQAQLEPATPAAEQTVNVTPAPGGESANPERSQGEV